MADYTCPLCNEKVERDAAVFMEHANKHISEAIAAKNPQWKSEDGLCAPCLEYYKEEMDQAD